MQQPKYIHEIEGSKLSHILAFYTDTIVFHKYNDEKEILQAGEFLTDETIREMFNFLNTKEINSKRYFFKNIIPQNVLHFKSERKEIMWTSPAKKQSLLFKTESLKNGNYPIPPLLWILKETKLYVFAIANDVVNAETKVYNAPFFNIYNDGLVCMGNAKFKEKSCDLEKIMIDVENTFYNSIFTHPIQNQLIKGNYVEYMKKIKNKPVFDVNLLYPTNKTIKYFFNEKI